MNRIAFVLLLIGLCLISSGCGETLSGVGKDFNRMGKGVSTFFFRPQ